MLYIFSWVIYYWHMLYHFILVTVLPSALFYFIVHKFESWTQWSKKLSFSIFGFGAYLSSLYFSYIDFNLSALLCCMIFLPFIVWYFWLADLIASQRFKLNQKEQWTINLLSTWIWIYYTKCAGLILQWRVQTSTLPLVF